MKRTHPKVKATPEGKTGQSRELMTVAQLADATDEPSHAIRYYCRIGLMVPSATSAGGYRLFDRTAANRLRFIRLSQGLGFTLEEIGGFIRKAATGNEPCPQVMTLLDQRLPQIGLELAQLTALHARMTRAQKRWKRAGQGVPTGHEICRLIESEAD